MAYGLLLVYGLLTPSPPDGPDTPGHLVAFLVLAVLVWWNASGPWREVVAWLGAIAIGCATELAQVHVPGRTMEVHDLAMNVIGSGIGAFGMGLMGRVASRPKPP